MKGGVITNISTSILIPKSSNKVNSCIHYEIVRLYNAEFNIEQILTFSVYIIQFITYKRYKV